MVLRYFLDFSGPREKYTIHQETSHRKLTYSLQLSEIKWHIPTSIKITELYHYPIKVTISVVEENGNVM